MDENRMGKIVMEVLCDIVSAVNSSGRDTVRTNKTLKRLRDKIVNFIKECQKPKLEK